MQIFQSSNQTSHGKCYGIRTFWRSRLRNNLRLGKRVAPVRSRVQGKEASQGEIKKAIKRMDSSPFLLDVLANGAWFTKALIDTGCLCYSAFDADLVRQRKLPRIEIKKRSLTLAKNDDQKHSITHITYIDMDVDGHKERIFGYIIKGLSFPMILGDPWMQRNNAVYKAGSRTLRIGSKKHGITVRESGWLDAQKPKDAHLTIGSVFAAEVHKARKKWRSATNLVLKRKRPKPK